MTEARPARDARLCGCLVLWRPFGAENGSCGVSGGTGRVRFGEATRLRGASGKVWQRKRDHRKGEHNERYFAAYTRAVRCAAARLRAKPPSGRDGYVTLDGDIPSLSGSLQKRDTAP